MVGCGFYWARGTWGETHTITIIIITAPPPRHGAAWMGNTMEGFIVHFDWMDLIREGGSGRGRRAPTK